MEIDKKKTGIVLGIEFFIALIFFIGADWAPARIHRLFHCYFADIAIPFGFYFLLMLNEDNFSFVRPWYSKALAVFLLASTAEILQFFGIWALGRTFDPLDFVMYATGALLAVLADMKVISKFYPAIHKPKS